MIKRLACFSAALLLLFFASAAAAATAAQAGEPARRGYYLGYLVAQEAAKTHWLRQLGKLDCKAARALVGQTVQTLKMRYSQ